MAQEETDRQQEGKNDGKSRETGTVEKIDRSAPTLRSITPYFSPTQYSLVNITLCMEHQHHTPAPLPIAMGLMMPEESWSKE
ncbi:hypothetical protein Pcinc_032018 [Petrolisthes cinctipes]|uniref:Uncharacterized protein n=2 Tax=Petrolisthes cinctipes TaxID=88211 RepID=A0AAE1K3Q5_PETCI|nr:hypothetical protein Pcinc_032018 [Petrolisthes cinctipes]